MSFKADTTNLSCRKVTPTTACRLDKLETLQKLVGDIFRVLTNDDPAVGKANLPKLRSHVVLGIFLVAVCARYCLTIFERDNVYVRTDTRDAPLVSQWCPFHSMSRIHNGGGAYQKRHGTFSD